MVKEILYTTAVDKNGNLIHIDNAEKGINYYCPICKNEFILRKSGKTGKGSKRPHFAHNQLSPNCTPESVLHYSFKKMLINLLGKYKSENKPLVMSWSCNFCNNKNSGNLLEKVASIKEEYNLKVCQPDIALLDEKANVFAVVEIVVTHEPKENVLKYYKENNIILIQINLSSEEDLNDIEKKIKKPNIVDYCLNPKCLNYEKYTINRKISINIERCGGCLSSLIEKYYIEINSIFGKQVSFDFTENEINFVKSKRANIEIKTNHTTKEKYPKFICLTCKRMRSKYRRSRLF